MRVSSNKAEAITEISPVTPGFVPNNGCKRNGALTFMFSSTLNQ